MIAELLWQGKENAISTQDLLTISGLRSARTMQSVIERERANGALILSTSKNGGGYYLPSDGEKGRMELLEFESTLKSRALNTLKTLGNVRRALDRAEAQQMALEE